MGWAIFVFVAMLILGAPPWAAFALGVILFAAPFVSRH